MTFASEKLNFMEDIPDFLTRHDTVPASCEAFEAEPSTIEMKRPEETEMLSLEPEIRRDIPNCEVALVTGSPYEAAPNMNFKQGSNSYNARGNCGLVSISNTLRRANIVISENEVTGCAIQKRLCAYDKNGNPVKNGGTTLESRKQVFRELGVESEVVRPGQGGDLKDIADAIDSGRGVVISVNAGILWDKDDGSSTIMGRCPSNHCVSVTGIARDAATGKVVGVYIADSGRGIPGDACRYLTVEQFHEVYTDVYNSGANITKYPLTGGTHEAVK